MPSFGATTVDFHESVAWMRKPAEVSPSHVHILRLLGAAEQYLHSAKFATSPVIVADGAGGSYDLTLPP